MQTHKLTGTQRMLEGKKANNYRKDGFIPAVLYGGKNKKTVSLVVPEKEFLKVYRNAGASSLVSLKIGENDVRSVLVHDVAKHAVSDRFMHIDFFEVRMDEKLKTKIPLVFSGESAAVKNEGGMLVRTMQEVEVECLPQYLPRELTVDISSLQKFHDTIRIRDLKLPEGVSVHAPSEEVVALVEEPRSEQELEKLGETPAGEGDLAQIKVEGEEERAKKKEEEDAAKKESAK